MTDFLPSIPYRLDLIWLLLLLGLLAAIGLYAWQKPEKRYQAAALNICRLIIAFTYLWSGLQKLNQNFIRETWPDIACPFLRWMPEEASNIPAPSILMIRRWKFSPVWV